MPATLTVGTTGYRLQTVWPAPTVAVRDEVVNFWLAEGALPDRLLAEARAPELLVVAQTPKGQVAGVSTAVRTFVPQLGFECFFYRTFVGQAHRTRGLRSTELVHKIGLHSFQCLNERFRQGYDPGVLGLYAEIENTSLMRVRNELVWQDSGMNAVYIGRTPDGRHIRVWYFDGARIP